MQAITRTPLDTAQCEVPRGSIVVKADHCKGCLFCISFCPKDVLSESTAMNSKGYHYPIVTLGKENSCVNCSFCTIVCPEFAIYSEERGPESLPYTCL